MENGATLIWRLTQVERFAERIDGSVTDLEGRLASKEEVRALREELKATREDVERWRTAMSDEMKTLRSALYGFALGVPGAAVIAVGGYLLGH